MDVKFLKPTSLLSCCTAARPHTRILQLTCHTLHMPVFFFSTFFCHMSAGKLKEWTGGTHSGTTIFCLWTPPTRNHINSSISYIDHDGMKCCQTLILFLFSTFSFAFLAFILNSLHRQVHYLSVNKAQRKTWKSPLKPKLYYIINLFIYIHPYP